MEAWIGNGGYLESNWLEVAVQSIQRNRKSEYFVAEIRCDSE